MNDATRPWVIPSALPLTQDTGVLFNTIIVESDWHIKRTLDISLGACGISSYRWSHPYGGYSTDTCNTYVQDSLKNGPNKTCIVISPSFSKCNLYKAFALSDIKYFALNIDSAGGYEETLKNDFVIRGAVRFALDPSGPQFHYTRV